MRTPTTLKECFTELSHILPPSGVEEFKTTSEDTATALAHHGIGQWMRNKWGLWSDSVLAKHLQEMGLTHADDMSGLILTCYHRHLNDKPFEIEAQVQYYKDYWKEKAKV